MKKIPSQGILNFDHVGERAGFGQLWREVQRLHVQQLSVRTELLTVVVITAENDVVDVHLLSDLIEADTGEMSGERNAGSIESVSAVLTGNKIKAATRHARPENFREGFRNPFEPGSF